MWVHGQRVEQSQAFFLPETWSCMALRPICWTEGVHCWPHLSLFWARLLCFFIFKGHTAAVFFNYWPWTISEVWSQFNELPPAIKKERKKEQNRGAWGGLNGGTCNSSSWGPEFKPHVGLRKTTEQNISSASHMAKVSVVLLIFLHVINIFEYVYQLAVQKYMGYWKSLEISFPSTLLKKPDENISVTKVRTTSNSDRNRVFKKLRYWDNQFYFLFCFGYQNIACRYFSNEIEKLVPSSVLP